MNALIEDLREWKIANRIESDQSLGNGLQFYWIDDQMFDVMDYNKEIVTPCSSYPDGAVGIRFDDDFWINAVLPYKYRELSVETICETLWPNQSKIYNPDVYSNE
jgi:hypothetical protein